MPRPAKDFKYVSVKMDASIHEKLEEYCRVTGQPKTLAIERMLDKELGEYFKQPEGKRVPV